MRLYIGNHSPHEYGRPSHTPRRGGRRIIADQNSPREYASRFLRHRIARVNGRSFLMTACRVAEPRADRASRRPGKLPYA